MNTYMGSILFIDLSSGKITIESFDLDFAGKYLGGNGFAAKILYDRIKPGTRPLSESNMVIFAAGPLNGTNVWGTSRGQAASISPLTGYYGDSNFGGDFAYMVKRTGCDAIAVSGRSESPVYISVSDETVKIKSAGDLWGMPVSETIKNIIKKEGPGTECAVIGPAGEREVLFANIMCSGKRISAAGRCGLGAVMGSKNCKGLAVRGGRRVGQEDPGKTVKLLNARYPFLKENAKFHRKTGTPFFVNLLNNMGKLPTRNARHETFADAGKISGEIIEEKYMIKNISCMRCPIACGKLVRVPGKGAAGAVEKMAEYETIYAFGSMLENSDLVSIFNANKMCDEMGVDTISMGVTMSFAAELFENNIIKKNEFSEEIKFGSGNDLPGLIKKTTYKQGIGEILRLGSAGISKIYGSEAEKYLYAVKGLELAGHSVRSIPQMGLGYATSVRGGSHHDTRPKYFEPLLNQDAEYIVSHCVKSQHFTAIGDSLVMCRFVMERGFGTELNEPLLEVINAATGMNLTVADLNLIGERIYNIERLISARLGQDRKDDSLPARATDEPIPDGPSKGMRVDRDGLETMLSKYYENRGWDNNGVPSKDKIKSLGI